MDKPYTRKLSTILMKHGRLYAIHEKLRVYFNSLSIFIL